jgi:hypothetical protein
VRASSNGTRRGSALVEEGKDRRDIGLTVNIPARRVDEQPLQRRHARNFASGFLALLSPLTIRAITLRETSLRVSSCPPSGENILAGFLALLPPLAVRAVALRPILVLARPTAGASWCSTKRSGQDMLERIVEQQDFTSYIHALCLVASPT